MTTENQREAERLARLPRIPRPRFNRDEVEYSFQEYMEQVTAALDAAEQRGREKALRESADFVILTEEFGVDDPEGLADAIQAIPSDDEVQQALKLLNAQQNDGRYHPYTCGGDRTDKNHSDSEGRLVATLAGWICPYCDYRQPFRGELEAIRAMKEQKK